MCNKKMIGNYYKIKDDLNILDIYDKHGPRVFERKQDAEFYIKRVGLWNEYLDGDLELILTESA